MKYSQPDVIWFFLSKGQTLCKDLGDSVPKVLGFKI